MAENDRAGNGVFRIKKYGNRRLYDTQQSRYITLEELAEIIQGGAAVRVADASSGKDITRQVLTQVILERQDALDMLPVELLHVIIRTQGTIEQAPFAAFLAAFTRQAATAGEMWTQPIAKLLRGLAQAVPGIGGPPATVPAEAHGQTPEPTSGEDGREADAEGPPSDSATPPALAPEGDRPGADSAPAAAPLGSDALRCRVERLLQKVGKNDV